MCPVAPNPRISVYSLKIWQRRYGKVGAFIWVILTASSLLRRIGNWSEHRPISLEILTKFSFSCHCTGEGETKRSQHAEGWDPQEARAGDETEGGSRQAGRACRDPGETEREIKNTTGKNFLLIYRIIILPILSCFLNQIRDFYIQVYYTAFIISQLPTLKLKAIINLPPKICSAPFKPFLRAKQQHTWRKGYSLLLSWNMSNCSDSDVQ